MPDKRLLTISTGGTIAGNVAGETSGAAQRVQRNLNQILKGTLSQVATKWDVTVKLESEELVDVDSSDIVPAHWTQIAALIKARYADYDGFIVTHGTNTMGYTCAALTFALPNLNKPVVVTGSQIPFGQPASDALMNLDNAVRTAAYPWENGIRGVVCVFGSHIITGARAKKQTEFDYDAFRSFGSAELGRIGRIMQINEDNVARHHSYLSRVKSPALRAADLIVDAEFDPRILSLSEFPGMSPEGLRDTLTHAVEQPDPTVRGVIIRAFGAGDLSTHMHPCLRYLKEQHVPVVITTQAPNGNSNFLVNVPGQAIKKDRLAIPAYDMSIEAITTKLAWLLAKGTTYAEMGPAMLTDFHGEINVMEDEKA